MGVAESDWPSVRETGGGEAGSCWEVARPTRPARSSGSIAFPLQPPPPPNPCGRTRVPSIPSCSVQDSGKTNTLLHNRVGAVPPSMPCLCTPNNRSLLLRQFIPRSMSPDEGVCGISAIATEANLLWRLVRARQCAGTRREDPASTFGYKSKQGFRSLKFHDSGSIGSARPSLTHKRRIPSGVETYDLYGGTRWGSDCEARRKA